MSRYYTDKKQEADNFKKITTFKLKEWGYFDNRISGLITWTNSHGDQNSASVEVVVLENESYLRIWYTQNNDSSDEKTNFDYKIPIVTTICNFGGVRNWFRCPWYKNGIFCGKRIAVLYKGDDYFACRHCFNLSYASKNENKIARLSLIGQNLKLEDKIERLEKRIKIKFYKGKPTRKYKKLIELKRRYHGFDTETLVADMAKLIKS